MQDQTCRTSPPTLVLALQTGAHLTERRTDASCISLDTVLISPSIEAGPLPVARIAGRVPGRLRRRTDAANGHTADLLVELIHARLAVAQPERMVAGGRRIEVARVSITEAGRRALTER